jgi:hypothetical protein
MTIKYGLQVVFFFEMTENGMVFTSKNVQPYRKT